MDAAVMQPTRHDAAPALRNAARAHASVLMVLLSGADGTPPAAGRSLLIAPRFFLSV